MRLDDLPVNVNAEDQGRGGGFGMGGGSSFGGGGGMGGGLGLIIGLIASRFGIGGIVVAFGLMWLLGMFGGGSGTGLVSNGQPGAVRGSGVEATGTAACQRNEQQMQACRVLYSTNQTWAALFAQQQVQYREPKISFYQRDGSSRCGQAQSAMGPFYCPLDQGIYLDTTFFDELATRFGASGDFAANYVIAHEVGHHVQTLTGTSDQVRQAQSRLGDAQGNRYQVAMELQADCYAGVWAAQNRDRIEPGDIQEGLRAAQAIGDDTLQKQAQGYVVPESFTHGTSAQRQQWLNRGLQTGDPAACDTFGALGLA